MPMFTTVRIRRPVNPVQLPSRTRSLNSPMRSSTACTSGTTLCPPVVTTAPFGARSATCRTARCSVVLIGTPSEHRVAPGGHAGRFGHVDQRRQDGVVDTLLGVVDAQIADLEQVAPAAVGIGGEEVAQVGGRGERVSAAHAGAAVTSGWSPAPANRRYRR